MTQLVKVRPFNDITRLHNDMNRFFEDAFNYATPQRANHFSLALDVVENDNAYTVKASMPGVSADDVEITLENNVLSIRGSVERDEVHEDERYHLRERTSGRCSRAIRLPLLVDSEAVAADITDGILTLTLPKAEVVKPRKIAISANSGAVAEVADVESA